MLVAAGGAEEADTRGHAPYERVRHAGEHSRPVLEHAHGGRRDGGLGLSGPWPSWLSWPRRRRRRHFIISLHRTLTLYVLCCVRAKRLKYSMTDFYFTLRLRDLVGPSERCTFGLQSCAIEYF